MMVKHLKTPPNKSRRPNHRARARARAAAEYIVRRHHTHEIFYTN